MREIRNLLAFEFRLMYKNAFFVSILLLCILVIPVVVFFLDGRIGETYWTSAFHVQMLLVIVALPTLFMFLWNEEVERFVPAVILSKLSRRHRYFVSKTIALWLFVLVVLSSTELMLMIMQAMIHGDGEFGRLFTLIYTAACTLGMGIQLVAFLSLLLRRVIYTNILLITYLLASIIVNHPMFSIWFNPDWVRANLFSGSFAFLSGRLFLLAVTVLLMVLNSYLFMRRVRA